MRYLQRLPLGLSYVDQVDAVAQLLARPPLSDARNRCELVIDETGVGRAVGDLFETAGLAPVRVTITAGMDQSWVGPRRHHVPKTVLISGLDARLHTGELRFAADLNEAGAMAEELKDFQTQGLRRWPLQLRRAHRQTRRLSFGRCAQFVGRHRDA